MLLCWKANTFGVGHTPIFTASGMSRKCALGTDNGQRHIRLDSGLNDESCETHSRPYCAVVYDSDEDMLSVQTGQ